MNTPLEVTNYNRTKAELEYFWLFCVFVAGKNSDVQLRKLNLFLRDKSPTETPFEFIRNNLNELRNMLVAAKVGQYARLVQSVTQSININLETCSVADLMAIYGVGSKTARFFILHTRKDADCVVLDTHVLKWLRMKGIDTPQNTPAPDKYAELENIAKTFIKRDFPYVTMAQADLLIWVVCRVELSLDIQFKFR